MRLRKKDWSSEVFEQFSDYLISDFEAIKGNWKETLKTDKLHVEIGAGKGDYWHQMSALYPERGIVAMERDFTASSIALKKLESNPGERKRFIYGDAEKLSEMFGPKEVDVVHLNFSDPWKKNRHEKRRLTYKTKLDDYYDVLTDTGEIWMKTDNVGLFNYSLVSVGSHKFELVDVHVDFRTTDDNDPFTEYERKFHEMGQPIFRAIWRKKDVK
ncbi:tRNA (guanosine(46)-N7)-methyltransferase TrmB [Erysipelothrix sp. HDW6B]|uniref:tRNA (guanosine(46)-N7)-methyltransferase TrmB n=1 Tax=Erysipelothrix TaxID=1647 RepID=UPI00135C276F|nr:MULTISPECIES: tRNA (guanosine(46)-N7)-methyltransferase TrmB [Erysipelothrix]QIK86463.1 tRNA (guanosine(46)-N7)-methyltransferase TrmB [Erysipelothrix sp. HDW6B]